MRVDFPFKDRYGFEDLIEIMRILRAPGGCPWDAKQTHQSIRKNFIEETYEAVEAIDAEDPVLLQEELGDVLLQVVYHAAMEEEQGTFQIMDVCDGVCKKLIHRHPHIFGDVEANTAEEVLSNWEAIKQEEKGQKTAAQTLESVSKALPALMRAEKIQQRAARAGMDYESQADAFRDLQSELEELNAAVEQESRERQTEELGDLLFSVVNVSRFIGADPEEALEMACKKFVDRFAAVEQLAQQRGIEMKSAGIQKLDELWREVKQGR